MSQHGQFTVNGLTEIRTLTGDVGAQATPLLGDVEIEGDGRNIITDSGLLGSHKVTIALYGTGEHCVQVGNLMGNLSDIPVATNGQILIGTTGGDPAFDNLGVGNGIASVEGAGTLSIAGIDATEAQVGVVELASDAETIAGVATVPVNTAICPTALKAKLGTQTLHGLAIGASDSAAITWTAEPADGQLLIGETGAAPSLGTLTAGANIGVASAAHSITLKVAGTTDHCVQVGNATGDLTSLAAGLNGETIMGTTGADPSWTSSPQFGGSVTALNDITSTAGSLVSIGSNVISRNAINDATGADITFQKVRVAALITSGDSLGSLRYAGYDGVGYITGAKITSTNSGTVGVNQVAGDLQFFTHPDAAIALPSEPLLRMTINSAGNVTVANPDSGTALTVTAGGLTVSAGNIVATLGDITASAGGISATLGALSAGTTVTAGTGISATTGNITADAGNLVATLGSVIAATNVTAPTIRTGDPATTAAIMSLNASTITLDGTGADVGLTITPKGVSGVILTTGNFLASTGNITATLGNIIATNGGVGAGTTVSAGTTVTAGTNLSSTAGNLTLPTTAAAAGQITINGNPFLHNYGYNQSNTFVGNLAGNLTLVKTDSDRGVNNTAVGSGALGALVGTNANEGRTNTAIGASAGSAITQGSYNVIAGSSAASSITIGGYNVIIGVNAGSSYVSDESSNITIGYSIAGTAGEDNVLRIGNGTGVNPGNLNKAVIHGISGYSTVASDTRMVTIDTGSKQMGVTPAASVFTQYLSTSSTPVTMVPGICYIATKAGAQTFNLPATAAIGDRFGVMQYSKYAHSINASAGDTIYMYSSGTASGTHATFGTTYSYSNCSVTCIDTDDKFMVEMYLGAVTLT
jgi:hypothetical protein